MKKLTPIVQRPQDLILAVVINDVLPDSQILVQKMWFYDDWQIRFAIIGESHRVSLTYQGQFVMEEMLACADISLQTCQHHYQLSDLRPHHYQRKNYTVAINVSDTIALWQTQDNEIQFVFPAINGKESLTKLQWQATQTSIQWRSLHSYICDGELVCVYSQSQYDFQVEE